MNFEFFFVSLPCLFIVRFGYPELKKASTLGREVIGGIVKERAVNIQVLDKDTQRSFTA